MDANLIQPDEVMTLSEAADFLRINYQVLSNMCRRGEGPSHSRTSGKAPGSKYRFTRSALVEWLGRAG